ncbi:hypothetical protein KIPB_008316, partial [Kipferlia bialata]|eukprot:g8316.t1
MTPDAVEAGRGDTTNPIRRPVPTSPASSSGALLSGGAVGVETPRQKKERERRERHTPRGAVPDPLANVSTFREHRGLGRTQPSNPRLDIRVGADPSLPTEGPDAPVRNKTVTFWKTVGISVGISVLMATLLSGALFMYITRTADFNAVTGGTLTITDIKATDYNAPVAVDGAL